jgi:hypothetical protein
MSTYIRGVHDVTPQEFRDFLGLAFYFKNGLEPMYRSMSAKDFKNYLMTCTIGKNGTLLYERSAEQIYSCMVLLSQGVMDLVPGFQAIRYYESMITEKRSVKLWRFQVFVAWVGTINPGGYPATALMELGDPAPPAIQVAVDSDPV